MTNRTWTVTMPSTAGQYEFRLFPNNGYTLAATSPVVRVDAVRQSSADRHLAVARTAFAGAAAFTLTVTGTGFVASSVVRWNGSSRTTTFVSATQLQAAIAAADVASAGIEQRYGRVTPAPGGGTSAERRVRATPPPTLTVSSTTATPGGSVTATLTNGGGG